MSRKVLLVVLFVLSLSINMQACDACGCGLSNVNVGLLSGYKNNFCRFSFFNARFRGIEGHGDESIDHFQIAELGLRYQIGRNLRLSARLPYRIHARENEKENRTLSGLSDVQVMANYALLSNTRLSMSSSLFLEVGAGVSLPTGKYDPHIRDTNLPENFNIGKGAVGFTAQMNAVYNYKLSGIVWSQSVIHFGKSKNKYQFGRQYQSQLQVFHEFPTRVVQWIPSVGVSFEHTTQDTHQVGTKLLETGGSGWFFTPSLNIRINDWIVGASYFLPIQENYSSGRVVAKERLSAHLSLNF